MRRPPLYPAGAPHPEKGTRRDSQRVTLMEAFNPGGAEVLRKALSLRHFSTPLQGITSASPTTD